MEKLSEDDLSNIFIRLPAKQLVQMRSVCKPWNAFLSESYFINFHLNHSNKDNEIVLLFDVAFDYGILSYQAFPCAAHDLSKSPVFQLNDLVKLPFNFPQSALVEYGGHVIGSVNGLICFYIGHVCHVKGIYILNPSLSVVMTPPPLSDPPALIPSYYQRTFCFGFGFDPKTDDYKVVKLTTDCDGIASWREPVEVYKGSWKFIDDDNFIPSDVVDGGVSMFVDDHDGHLHWLCTKVDDIQTIVAFDLGVESFRQISLPDSIAIHRYNVLGMSARKLCVVSYTPHDGGKYEVWMMNEYGVACDSWVKSHVLSKLEGKFITPLGFTLNNKFLFCDDSKGLLGSYDQETDKVTHFGSRHSDTYCIVQYVDSLVWYAAPTN